METDCAVIGYIDTMRPSRAMKGGRVDPARLPKGPNKRNFCRWCALEVPKGRRTFCSEWCVHEWRLRTDMGYLREQVFARDKGICAECGMDTKIEWQRIQRLRGERRRQVRAEWKLLGLKRQNLWDADHIVSVAEGGGECDLSNIRTLCLKCHRRVTAELRDRLRSRKGKQVHPFHVGGDQQESHTLSGFGKPDPG